MPINKKPSKRFFPKIKKALHLKTLTEKELVQNLKVPLNVRKKFQEEIRGLIKNKKLFLTNSKLSLKKETLLGTLSVHPRGFGFVIPKDKKAAKDVFIPKKYIEGAVDGDLVEVELFDPPSPKGWEGKILHIVKRNKKYLVGTVAAKENKKYSLVVPSLKDQRKVLLAPSQTDLQRGDRVVVEVDGWGKQNEPILCSLKKKIGSISEAKTDILAALEEFQIEEKFPEKVIQEAKSLGKEVDLASFSNRINYTKLPTITIDPETAKDFDDALSLEIDKKKNYHLYVHIADVAHYVKSGSALDEEAYKRANSVYFPGKCVPMLPEELSNELCSLKPEVVRLTITVKMVFSPEGDLLDTQIHRSVIRSQKRFTYEEAFSVLKKEGSSPFYDLLSSFKELCLLLKQKRTQRGSIDFALPEAQVLVDAEGNPLEIRIHEYDITHQLVEEFMLKANETVATTLFERGSPVIYRIHEEPAEEGFTDFFDIALKLGFSMPANPKIQDIQKLFQQAKGTAHFQRLSIAFIRSMKLAFYSSENRGHYGLCLQYYTHFTSPIRRYSDLIISRLLFQDPVEDDLVKLALQCSEKERNAMKAEQSVVYLKKLRLLKKHSKQDPKKTFLATITKIKPTHMIFELDEYFLESSLAISQVSRDYLHYDSHQGIWVGRRSKEVFSCGDKIEVKLRQVDLIYQNLQFSFLKKHEA